MENKGGVENLVGYVRRNFLVPPPESDDYGALNAYLPACCDRDARERRRGGRTVEDLWREEQEVSGAGEAAGRLRLPLSQGQPASAGAFCRELVFGTAPIRGSGGDRPGLRLPGGDSLAGSRDYLPEPQLRPGGRGPGPSPSGGASGGTGAHGPGAGEATVPRNDRCAGIHARSISISEGL